jgi:hypothetical protein
LVAMHRYAPISVRLMRVRFSCSPSYTFTATVVPPRYRADNCAKYTDIWSKWSTRENQEILRQPCKLILNTVRTHIMRRRSHENLA